MTPQISKSAIEIGPIKFTYQVQDISIQEEKAVQILPSTRTNKNFVSDSGATNQKAIVRLLVTGLDEINSELSKLVALFRCCPIVSVKNEMISTCWNLGAAQIDPTTLTATVKNQRAEIEYSGFIPVALEEINISSVPDIPLAVYVTLTMTRVDVSSIYPDGELLYQGEGRQSRSPYGGDAFYLKKWIEDPAARKTLTSGDFSGIEISWYGEYSTGERIKPDTKDLTKLKFTKKNKNTKVYSESASLRNLFSYKNCIGKGIPFAQHMGSTSRFYSIDILFADQENNTDFNKFCLFKESSDYIARAKDRFARVAGWVVSSPIAKLLQEPTSFNPFISKATFFAGRLRSNAFVPLHISIENSDQPLTKAVRLDMAESNIDFFNNAEVKLLQGGSDYEDMKKYFKTLVQKEYEFRLKLINNPAELAMAITGQNATENGSDLFDAYSTFWPIVNGNIDFGTLETFGILNRDTLKAVLLSPEFDDSERLAMAIEQTPIISGKYTTGVQLPNIITRIQESTKQLQATVFGPDEKLYANLYNIIKEYVQSIIFGDIGPDLNSITDKLTSRLFISMLGDYSGALDFSNESGQAVQDISRSTVQFSDKFINGLFEVIVQRKSINRPTLRRIYSIDGISTAFYKLLIKYTGDSGTYPTDPSERSNSTAVNAYFKRSVYEDLLLPSYYRLYGDEWKEFAPTYDDLGLVNSNSDGTRETDAEGQLVLAVDSNHTVPPSAWFFHIKYKPRLLAEIKDGAKNVSAMGHDLQLSMPFEVDDINEIEQLTGEISKTTDEEEKNKLRISLSKLIRNSFRRSEYNDEQAYNETMNQLSIANLDKFEKEYMQGDKKLSVYVHHNGNVVRRKQLTVPGVAAEIFKVAKDYKLLRPNSRLEPLDTDEGHRSADRANEFEFIRSLDENTAACLRSDLSQMPEIYEHAGKMFPAIKVYLLEKRGSDLYGDDTFFSVNPIMSVDITMDKDDADLAVITIADPLYILQNSYFPQGGVQSVKGLDGKITKQVVGSLRGSNVEGYLKRYKITEGRAVQIRLGYDSMPENLKIAFTGKIVEISPGDTLTLVCQGWKSELINRQVNFYNDNVKNWGARDLAIMTMQHANPDGFGDFFPQMSSDYILKNLQTADVQEAIQVALNRQEGVETVEGSRDVGNTISNAIKESLSLESTTKQNQGLDTRLKNIWWPDLASYNNVLGWRNWSEIMPSQINDSWVVPLQPAWEVFKEASRHSWNSIVAVVPYDGEATLFFGHPDQPYIFTRGGTKGRRGWQKYINNKKSAIDSSSKIIKGFQNSKEYNIKQEHSGLDLLLNTDVVDGFDTIPITDAQVLLDLESLQETLIKTLNSPDTRLGRNKPELYQSGTNANGAILGGGLFFTGGFSLLSKVIPCFTLLNKILRNETSTINRFGNIVVNKNFRTIAYERVINSSLPFEAYKEIQSKLGRNTIPTLLRAMFDFPINYASEQWPGAEIEFTKLLRPANQISDKEVDYIIETKIDNGTMNRASVTAKILETYRTLVGKYLRNFSNKRLVYFYPKEFIAHKTSTDINYLIRYAENIDTKLSNELVNINKKVREIENTAISIYTSYSKKRSGETISLAYPEEQDGKSLYKLMSETYDALVELVNQANLKPKIISDDTSLSIKLFVFFFNEYLKNLTDPEVNEAATNIKSIDGILPPNMQVFRQHHWVDSDHDILKNDIVASTKDMWNTVIVEHPAHAEAAAKVGDESELFGRGDFYSGIKWVYYPKQEVSGVMGLQFHPGLTLANKKLKIFTELNCQSNELAAKLACTHLADGIRRMYRGTLMLIGRNIKPHDRIIINDEYTKMTGPLEVESVVHHWSVDTGWVTNIGPQAVCDANPGAAVLQTAAMEDTFNKVFKTIDFVSDAISIAIIVASLGGGAALASGSFSIKEGIKASLKGILSSGRTKFVIQRLGALGKNTGEIGNILLGSGGNPFKVLGGLFAKYGGAASSYFTNWSATELSRQVSHLSFRMLTTSSFVTNAQKTQQLPIILNPVYYNGLPFLAGMDTDDPIWAVNFNDTFWSVRDLNKSAEQVLETLYGTSYQQTSTASIK